MKKFLLSLAVAAFAAFGASAETATFDASTKGYANQEEITSVTFDGFTLTFDKGGSSNTPKYYTTGKAIRCYAKNTIKFTAPAGATMTAIDITVSSTSAKESFNDGTTVSDGTYTLSSGSLSWTGSASEMTLTVNANTTSGHARVQKVVITYSMGSAPTVERPVISQDGNYVMMSCETEGAKIYYTEDGTDPTEASSEYITPIDLWMPTDFKAIAIKDGEKSSVTSFESTYTMETEGLANFADVAGALEERYLGRVIFDVKCTLTVLYQSGQNLYVKDTNNQYMLVYGAKGTYTNGDLIAGMTCTYTPFNGLPEVSPITMGEKTAGEAVEPMEMEIYELTTATLNWYVKLLNVTVSDVADRNFTLTDAENESIPGYNSMKITLPTDLTKKYDVTGFVSYHKSSGVQFAPVAFAEVESVATPTFSIASGEILTQGTKVALSCATEGATIYYTLDGTEPTAASTAYTEEIAVMEDVTIKAIAVKEGMANSEVATAEYKVDPQTVGIETIEVEAGEAEYFNLQGIRVANPENGIFIRRQAGKAVRVIL